MDEGHLCNLRIEELCRCPIQFQPVRKETVEYYMLRDSIRDVGIITPILVRIKDGRYEVVCGNHRLECAKDLRLPVVPCLVREIPDEEIPRLQVIENANRIQPRTVDYIRRLQKMIHTGESDINTLAYRIHRHPDWVRKLLSLNHLCSQAKTYLDAGALPIKIGIELARLPVGKQEELLPLLSDLTSTEALEICREVVRGSRISYQEMKRRSGDVRPHYRKNFQEVVNESVEPRYAASVLSRAGIDLNNPIEVWKSCIKWVIQMDEQTYNERRARRERSIQQTQELKGNYEHCTSNVDKPPCNQNED